MLDEERCRRAIHEAFPALDLQSVRYFSAGWDYELWEINDELLFRFPMREECAEALRVESRLLAALAEYLSLAVPRPAYVSDGVASFQQPFFAYRKLPGVPLSEADLSENALSSTGQQIGRFLRELHSFPKEQAAALGVLAYSAESWRAFYVDFHAQCDRRVNPLLAASERERVADFWSGFLDDDRNFRFAPSLVHADLGPSHILVDPETGEVSGVIDFGDARVGDPAIDIVGLLRVESAVLAGYGDRADETFRRRARVYWQIGPFHEVLYGLDIDKREHIDAGLAGIRSRVTEAT
jgi:aminoglycoside phosphotransferase (APT) family kinase protein